MFVLSQRHFCCLDIYNAFACSHEEENDVNLSQITSHLSAQESVRKPSAFFIGKTEERTLEGLKRTNENNFNKDDSLNDSLETFVLWFNEFHKKKVKASLLILWNFIRLSLP